MSRHIDSNISNISNTVTLHPSNTDGTMRYVANNIASLNNTANPSFSMSLIVEWRITDRYVLKAMYDMPLYTNDNDAIASNRKVVTEK